MNDICTKVREAGVVGAGGAGFPTHVKLKAQVEIYLVNGAECEPMLKTDQQLAALYPERIVRGLASAMSAAGAKEGIIALKAKYQQAIGALQPHLAPNMRVAILPDVYPAGDEVMTIWLTTGRRVPPGGIPLDIGVAVNNLQTILNVGRALDDEPVTTRTLTVNGAVREPKTVTVPIGTSLTEVLALAGGPAGENLAYIAGGPVMGKLLDSLDMPVSKTSGGLLALPADHPVVKGKMLSAAAALRTARAVCEQCRLCTDLCPRHLIGHELPPHLIIRAVNYNRLGAPQVLLSALTCSECGVCEVYACPVGISPRRVNIALKAELRTQGLKYRGEIGQVDPMAEHRLLPSSRLVSRLHLEPWYHEAPLVPDVYRPAQVVIPLQQHVGAPAQPVVKEGDRVQAGQVIGEIPEGSLGARVHASIDGIVARVTPQAVTIRKEGSKQ